MCIFENQYDWKIGLISDLKYIDEISTLDPQVFQSLCIEGFSF